MQGQTYALIIVLAAAGLAAHFVPVLWITFTCKCIHVGVIAAAQCYARPRPRNKMLHFAFHIGRRSTKLRHIATQCTIINLYIVTALESTFPSLRLQPCTCSPFQLSHKRTHIVHVFI